jgi:hypothetical protein
MRYFNTTLSLGPPSFIHHSLVAAALAFCQSQAEEEAGVFNISAFLIFFSGLIKDSQSPSLLV